MGHVENLIKFQAIIPKKHNSFIDSLGIHLDRYTNKTASAPYGQYTISSLCNYSDKG